MRRIGAIALVAALAAGLLVVGGLGPARPTPDPGAGRGTEPAFATAARGTLVTGTISSLQERLSAVPGDWGALAALGLAYVQEARVTGDPTYYPKAEEALTRSLDQRPTVNPRALIGMGALALGRHDFDGARRYGRRALSVHPGSADALGVIGDALIELGRYGRAFAAYQRMVDARPDLASYARASYARELRGDAPGAIVAMREALGAAAGAPDRSWAAHQLGDLWFSRGRVTRAASWYRRAAELAPEAVPPRVGLARVAWARGDLDRAIRGYTWAATRTPLPEHVIALGELYILAGDAGLAERQFDLARAEAALFRANGVNVDLELALFDADHGRARPALRAARAEWSRRRSVHAADALGWALYASGRFADAARYADRALALGTKDASFLFHAAMIRLELGYRDEARRLLTEVVRTNPHFSIRHASVARRTLASLGGPA
jgi:tetratricopeptide (TPR) repeat protein